jgi:hypothetical protein
MRLLTSMAVKKVTLSSKVIARMSSVKASYLTTKLPPSNHQSGTWMLKKMNIGSQNGQSTSFDIAQDIGTPKSS